jgi:hypothetical protein
MGCRLQDNPADDEESFFFWFREALNLPESGFPDLEDYASASAVIFEIFVP